MKRKAWKAAFAACAILTAAAGFAAPAGEPKMHRRSTTIERERPELNEETKRLIAAYRRNPTEANRAALRKQVELNYDKVLARKKAKLEDLKRTARHEFKVREMQEIVDEMIQSREERVEQSMRRFADPRLRPGARITVDGWLPVLGAGRNVFIAYVPVTNAEYAEFLKATNRKAPKAWKNGSFPAGKERHPATNVSLDDAKAYCKWLSSKEKGGGVFRLPTEEEWIFAAGHMPKDADFNCGERDGTSPVDAYAKTLSACGAIDMWGNCWEWTSTPPDSSRPGAVAGKGGPWNTPRTDCRTELKGVGRNASKGYDDVCFRVVRER